MTARDLWFTFAGFIFGLACACFKWWRWNRAARKSGISAGRSRAQQDIDCYYRGAMAGRRSLQVPRTTRGGNQMSTSAQSNQAGAREYAPEKPRTMREREGAAEERQRLEWSKEKAHKSFSWHVGYHLREIKSLTARLEWHAARAVACKARVKKPAETQAVSPIPF